MSSAIDQIPSLSPDSITSVQERSPLQVVWMRFRKHRLAMISLCFMVVVFGISLFARSISPFSRDEVNINMRFAPIGAVEPDGRLRTHVLGTDNIGRDYLTRVVYAARISLAIAVFSVIISEVVGVTVGALAGYFGGAVDNLLMRLIDFITTIPTLPLLLIISVMLLQSPELIPIPKFLLDIVGKFMLLDVRNARSAILIVLILAGLGWLTAAELMRGMLLSIREQTYIEASRALGGSHNHIIFNHMIPNALAPIIVDASLGLAGYIVAEASLSFLGFGIQDPVPTWGNMLATTQQFMLDRPYLPLIPGLPIFFCSLAFNYIGDGLRDALDPRLKM